jgi:hypothetical protein
MKPSTNKKRSSSVINIYSIPELNADEELNSPPLKEKKVKFK